MNNSKNKSRQKTFRRREEKQIYTRNYGKQNRSGVKYSPPPGYDGNAFSETPSVKLHEAEDDVTRLPRRPRIPAEPEPDERDLFEEPETFSEPEPFLEPEPEPENAPEPERMIDPSPPAENFPVFHNSIQSLETLFSHLRGKFGREELIIVLVMLLIASDGASIELMLLALILIAG